MFTTRFQAWVRRLALRAAARLEGLPLTPNQVTLAGFGVTVVAAALVGMDRAFVGGLVLLFAGVFDILDGALARASNRSYPFGAFLDSTTDRFSEAVIMVGVAVFFQRRGMAVGTVLVVLATAGSLLVSYVKARAEALGFKGEGGLLARPERVLLMVIGLLLTPLHPVGLLTVVAILAVFSNFTVLQRVWIVWRQSRALALRTESAARAVRPAPPEPARPKPEEREVRQEPEPAGG